MGKKFDFSGWATKANIKCTDGRTILKDAFKHNDGKEVPLVWNHQHNGPENVLGKALLEHRDEGVYAYCTFNDSEYGKLGKILVQHGDITSLSIMANQLKEHMSHVMHGNIREVSLVLAGANPGASIQAVMMHSDDGNEYESTEEAYIFTGEEISLYHADEEPVLEHADDEQKEGKVVSEETKKPEASNDNKTVKEILDTLNEEQLEVVQGLVGIALGESIDDDDEIEHSEGGDGTMKYNVFNQTEETQQGGVLTHADTSAIVELAKKPSVGSLKEAIAMYVEESGVMQHSDDGELAHGIFEDYSVLFPDFELLKKGEPETLERDQSWIAYVMNKIHKSPYSRIRTRQADARIAELRAKGYQKKGDEKKIGAKIKMIGRTTDPQTIYIKEDMHRDDIIDITDFDPVAYQWRLMEHVMKEELALAALVGDGREDGDPDKIHESHIRSIWNDEELYTIRADVDIAAAKAELQGSNTGANFGDNYIYAEAIITAALYAREKYKGTGTPDLFCTPHLVNVMLLARDLNGRRIYDSKADLAAALNVNAIHTVEQFEGKTRTDENGNVKKLLGLFVNLSDYQFGSTKGGQITRFEDFDMDFNKYKYMLETRLSGSLTKLFSAIALEEPVAAGSDEEVSG